jgi:hypothetical protein
VRRRNGKRALPASIAPFNPTVNLCAKFFELPQIFCARARVQVQPFVPAAFVKTRSSGSRHKTVPSRQARPPVHSFKHAHLVEQRDKLPFPSSARAGNALPTDMKQAATCRYDAAVLFSSSSSTKSLNPALRARSRKPRNAAADDYHANFCHASAAGTTRKPSRSLCPITSDAPTISPAGISGGSPERQAAIIAGTPKKAASTSLLVQSFINHSSPFIAHHSLFIAPPPDS